MGFRFYKSLRIAPGVRLNFSKSGVSTSLGGRGATFNIGPRSTRTTVGLPGTGLHWTETRARGQRQSFAGASNADNSSAGANGCAFAVVLAGLIGLIGMCSATPDPPATSSADSSSLNSAPATIMYVQVRSANCRLAGSKTASIVKAFPRATGVKVSETVAGWSHVDDAPAGCWISADLLGPDLPMVPVQPAAGSSKSSKAVGLYGSSSSNSRSSRPRRQSRTHYDEGCPCSGDRVCIGPRGGRYCITSGGNKRYGV